MLFATDPKAMEELLLKDAILSSSSLTHIDHTSYYNKHTKQYKRVSKIGNKVIKAAKIHIENKIKYYTNQINNITANNNINNTTNSNSTNNTTNTNIDTDIQLLTTDLIYWERALRRIDGEWEYIVIKDNTIVNAFITDSCPRKIFIVDGFFDKLEPTDDELALVLCHEISHTLLSHSESKVC